MAEEWFQLIFGDTNRVSNPLFVSEESFFDTDSFDLKQGKEISAWNKSSYLKSVSPEDDGMPDDLLGNISNVPIFSQRLRDELAARDIGLKNVQYLPLKIIQSTGKTQPGFAIANIITRLAALDYDKSEDIDIDETTIDPLTGKPEVEGLFMPALKRNLIQGHDIIRLLEFFPSVLVSGRFRALFLDKSFTGVTFKKVLVV